MLGNTENSLNRFEWLNARKPKRKNPKTKLVVPLRFKTEVRNFITAASARAVDETIAAPQILIIAGPPGTGKTKMADLCCKEFGITSQTLSASSLAGQFEGDSLQAFTEAIIRAGSRQQVLPIQTVIIEDADLSAGRQDERLSGTINSSLLSGCMMNYADHPEQITTTYIDGAGVSKSKTHFIHPSVIIKTVNNVDAIYEPLQRDGRAKILNWRPTKEETAKMVAGIFPQLEVVEIHQLVSSFPEKQISFFGQLPSVLAENLVDSMFKRPNASLSDGRFIREIAEEMKTLKENCTVHMLLKAGKKLERQRLGARNHLAKRENRNEA